MSDLKSELRTCSVGGDHPASGGQVAGVTIPMGWHAGYQVFANLLFCEDHIDESELTGFEPGVTYHGTLQFGFKDV